MMKIQNMLRKVWVLALVCITLIVVTILKLSPSFAHSTATTAAQISAPAATIADSTSQSSGGNSLYKRLGGYNAIASVIDDAAQYIFNDPQIGKYFIGLSTNSKQRLRELLIDQFCAAAGGPCIYTGRTMKLSHSGIGGGLTNSEFNAFVNDVALALNKNNVNQKERDEVVAFVHSLKDQIVEK